MIGERAEQGQVLGKLQSALLPVEAGQEMDRQQQFHAGAEQGQPNACPCCLDGQHQQRRQQRQQLQQGQDR
ncbi:MAG: hypothetical protein AB2811_13545 [Candidatus Sedimenticola endophacoides]